MAGFFNKLVGKFFGDKNEQDVKEVEPYVQKINDEYVKLSGLSNDELRAKTAQKEKDAELEVVLLELLPQAFAVVKETASRFKDMLHYDVQLIGGVILHQGKIAEMQTGEGKTLVATLPAYLNGLTGLGVHIVTVNNYLAVRDCQWMGGLLNFLGLTVDCIDNYRPHSDDRVKAYNCDITYGTNNEFGFDYLRDNMVRQPSEQVQGKHHYAMIDEVDSVLVDDARTPLIISGAVEKGDQHEFRIKTIQQKVENFYMQEQNKKMHIVDEELFFTIDEKSNQVDLTEMGIEYLSEISDEEKIKAKDQLINDFSIKSERIHSVQQLLKAYALFEKDVEYVVMDEKVKIVDEQTGRIMEGRRYSDGLHQAIEAKENVKVEAATQTFATITLQNYFRMFHKLAGMTGTAETEAGEFWDIYKLDVVVIPTNRPIQRDDREDLVYRTVKEKFNAVIDEVNRLTAEGRPVLVGTTNVEISELLSRMLEMKGVKHNVLNAKQHSREADIVAEAGLPGNVTIATNMAGRGTDIKLSQQVKEAGGLAIIGTERHDSRRVDRQLRGRAGRQGDPGSSQFYVSLEDNLMRLFGSERIAGLMDKMGYDEGEVIQHSMITKSIERAQKKVEENNFGIRKRLLDYDDVMNSQREVIYKRRKHALYGERLSVDLSNSFYDLCEEIIVNHKNLEIYDDFKLDVIRYFSLDTKITVEQFKQEKPEILTNQLYNECLDYYARKKNFIVETTMPIIRNVHENRGETIVNISVPFNDGKRGIQVSSNLDRTVSSNGAEMIKELEKSVSLSFIDEHWKNHLRQMDDLKQSVQLAVHEQKDPLLIYKFESFELFKDLLSQINRDVVAFLFKASLPMEKKDDVKEARTEKKTDMSKMKAGRSDLGDATRANAAAAAASGNQERRKPAPVRVAKKVGRNEPCPCGSGKKYKQCHGKGE
ncbi:UNVERIFIED_CONTAM: hypothetical protein GTU68_034141 [Idotea baltica]|nr:hypothetical protein [Idotea baltica]